MRKYELALVFPPDGEAKDREKLLGKVKEEVEKSKGKIEKVDEWGKKQLSFPMKHYQEGLFFLLEFSLPPESLSGLERKIKLEEGFIRYLLVRVDD